jgi:hypothetical protein
VIAGAKTRDEAIQKLVNAGHSQDLLGIFLNLNARGEIKV